MGKSRAHNWNRFEQRHARGGRGVRALGVALMMGVSLLICPHIGFAAETAKLSAQPNGETGSEIFGGVDTRVTWEIQAASDEQIDGLSLTFPQGTSFGTEDLRVTLLSGDDLMDREFIKPKITQEGETLRLGFPSAAPAGAYARVEVYDVVFPEAGGSMQFSGSYKAGSQGDVALDDFPAIEVAGRGLTDRIEDYLEQQSWVEAWNSNTFLRLFFNPLVIVSSFPVILQGFLMALAIVLVAFPVAIPCGFIFALMRISKSRVLRALASVYVNLIRGTPAFLQIYIAFFGLPLAGINIDNYLLGVIVMAMNSTAYLCEIFRAGIQSIPKGQFEAARSLGMTGAQTMVWVIVPQTFRNVIPTLTSEFILLYKDTSLLAAVGVMEVVMYARTIVATTGSITPYVVAALFYLVVTLPLARLISGLERRLLGGNAPAGTQKRPLKSAGVVVPTPPDHIAGL